MKRSRMLRRAVVGAALGVLLLAGPGSLEARSSAGHRAGIPTDSEVCAAMKAFEADYNRGDLAAIEAHYDAGFLSIWDTAFSNRDEYLASVRHLVSGDHPRMALEVQNIVLLGDEHLLVNGMTHLFPRADAEQISAFSLIYRRVEDRLRFVYVHSSPTRIASKTLTPEAFNKKQSNRTASC